MLTKVIWVDLDNCMHVVPICSQVGHLLLAVEVAFLFRRCDFLFSDRRFRGRSPWLKELGLQRLC